MKNSATRTKEEITLVSPVVVLGAGFRFLAFRDGNGRLRDFWTQQLVPSPVHILDPEN